MKLKECSYEKFVTFIYCLSIKFHIISNFWEIASGNTIFQGYTMIDVFLKKKKKKTWLMFEYIQNNLIYGMIILMSEKLKVIYCETQFQ